MSQAAWMCLNTKCGLLFQWNGGINTATYDKNGELVSKYVPGETKPSGCPECGEDEVDSLEG